MSTNKYRLSINLFLTAVVAITAGILTGCLNEVEVPQISRGFSIYAIDEQAATVKTDLYIKFDDNFDQTQQLKQLSNFISRYNFCNLPIEVKSVNDGIAMINLDEHSWVKKTTTPPSTPGCSGKSWRYGYFQGSAGGLATTEILTRSFVQPDFKGKWIKGVRFSYAGKPIQDGDWDHISLDGVFNSKNLP